MQWITDVTRKNICDVINNSPMLLISTVKLFSGNDKNINFEMLLIDYYNTLMMKKNINTLSDEEIKFLELINNHKVNQLKSLNANLDFVRNAFIATVNFESLAILDKHQITNVAYQEKDNNDLTSRPLYKLNYIASNLSNNKEDLINCYKEYIDINGDALINHDSARDIIVNHLQKMKLDDLESYKRVVLSAIPVYYKWGKYTLSKYKKEVDATSKKFLRRIELLKLDDLLELTKYDNEFLADIITQYLYFEILPENITKESDEYCNKILRKRMKIKLDDMKEK